MYITNKNASVLRYKGKNSFGRKVICCFYKVERKDCPNIKFIQLGY